MITGNILFGVVTERRRYGSYKISVYASRDSNKAMATLLMETEPGVNPPEIGERVQINIMEWDG